MAFKGFFSARLLQQRVAQEVLTNLKDHPDAWTRVDTILEFSQNMKTKVRTQRALMKQVKAHTSCLLTVCQGRCDNVSWRFSVYPHQAKAFRAVRLEHSLCFCSTVLIRFSPANGSLLCLNLWLSAKLCA